MANDMPRRSARRNKKRRFWPIILLLTCFFASAAAGAFFADNTVKKITAELARNAADAIDEEPLLRVEDKTTVLIMGVDQRIDDVGRSDTMMVATVDPITNRAALLSIPRDTRVKIKNRGYDKINAAYAYGGVFLAENTVENFLGIDIDHYLVVNTHAFVNLIDALGGIDINVEKRMYYEDPWDDDGGLVIDLYPGMQHLDGKDAVTYVRYRDSEGDIGRVKRQQYFIHAVIDKLTSPSVIPKVPSLIRETVDAVDTDLSFKEILELAGSFNDAYKNGLDMDMVPGRPLYIDNISYWIPDIEMLRLSVADTLGIQVDPFLRERFQTAASEYNSSIPDDAEDVPDDENVIGRPVKRPRVDTRSDYDRDRSYDREDRMTVNEYANRNDRRDYDRTSDDRADYSSRNDRRNSSRDSYSSDRDYSSTYDYSSDNRADQYDRYERSDRADYDRTDRSSTYDQNDYDRTDYDRSDRSTYERTDYGRYDRSSTYDNDYSDRYDNRSDTNSRRYDSRADIDSPRYDDDVDTPDRDSYRR